MPMLVEARTPVVVGVGEVTHRGNDFVDPIDLAVEAARRAVKDAGRPVERRIDTVATPGILVIPRDNPASRIAEAMHISPARRISCPVGGNTPQYLVEVLGGEIREGRADVVLVVGAESGHSARKLQGRALLDSPPPPRSGDESLGDARPGLSQAELSVGLSWPHEVYPIFESAIAARHGRDFDAQREWLGTLMAPFTAEAARHPEQAWFPRARSATELSEVTAENRMVCLPYPKLLNSIMSVDMAAAFILMAAEVADELGVARDRWVFPWSAATCNDVYFPVERPDLSRSSGIEVAARKALNAGRLTIDDIRWFDLYSCFPSAIEMAAEALDLDPLDDRGLTVTGGLPYHGGPGNNYVSHSIVEMVRRCRRDPTDVGLVTGLGWYSTKHSVGLWSATPPPTGWRLLDTTVEQAQIDSSRLGVAGVDEATGCATVDGYTVVYDRDGQPRWTPIIAHLSDGQRVVARSDDPQIAEAMGAEMYVGKTVCLRNTGSFTGFELP